ncbi:tyrosine-protein phosphatase non-receptor type 18 [Colossoma macropomum]|uniref:tyrosine-protein phosphatase non-receptor type 18 n=1 Tax=Colossoma macropomum TaxID=42526 RepID=UPI0018645196|nr:tyrosine-protein phosphatase non-receptor type 18 [Colossoma macropomum]
MEAYLLKFVERVRCLSEKDDGDAIASEYARIRQQNGSMKELYGLTAETGGIKENVKKNRYKDILPYDQTRVILSPILPDYSSDYINANFIKGATQNKTYIATQGPLSYTVVDFWRMIWQYKIQVIVMACKEIEMGKKKCEAYWGSLAEPSTFGPFTVSTVEESYPNEEVIVRTLTVKCGDETRSVSQLQYTAWPDHGIPYVPDGILGMMELANIRQANHTGPMLIHCSAGCGRTGVICAIDYINDLLHEKKIGDGFNIMDIVLELRRQRPSAVQTKEQYEFVFHTVAQIFEKALGEPSHPRQNQTKFADSLSIYSNVVPPKPALRSASIGSSNPDPKTRKPPLLRPRSSHPPPSSKMNDTYAVVNKTRQPSAPRTGHHYDNLDLESQKSPNNALYSTVKPKNRAAGTLPVYDRALPVNQRGSMPSLEAEFSGYEPLPAEFRARNSQLQPPPTQGPSDGNGSSEDDYEYVTNPIRDSSSSSSYCSPGGLGFKCRIKKPKGPRDPPAEWNRPER